MVIALIIHTTIQHQHVYTSTITINEHNTVTYKGNKILCVIDDIIHHSKNLGGMYTDPCQKFYISLEYLRHNRNGTQSTHKEYTITRLVPFIINTVVLYVDNLKIYGEMTDITIEISIEPTDHEYKITSGYICNNITSTTPKEL